MMSLPRPWRFAATRRAGHCAEANPVATAFRRPRASAPAAGERLVVTSRHLPAAQPFERAPPAPRGAARRRRRSGRPILSHGRPRLRLLPSHRPRREAHIAGDRCASCAVMRQGLCLRPNAPNNDGGIQMCEVCGNAQHEPQVSRRDFLRTGALAALVPWSMGVAIAADPPAPGAPPPPNTIAPADALKRLMDGNARYATTRRTSATSHRAAPPVCWGSIRSPRS